MSTDHTERILTLIRQIPAGKVATYGQIAKLAGIPRNARQVGAVLRNLHDNSVPWFRVVNSKGQISGRKKSEFTVHDTAKLESEASDCESIQRQALEEENIVFDSRGSIPLDIYGWDPQSP